LTALAAGALATRGVASLQSDSTDEIGTLYQELIGLKEQTSDEKRQLAETRVFLEEEIALLEQRIGALKENTATLEEERGDTADKRAELEEEKAALDAGTQALEDAIVGLEARLLAVRPTLPAPLTETVNKVARNVPKSAEEAEEKKLDLYTRFVQVVGALNYIDNFNDDVTISLATLEIPALGKAAEVTTIYLGVGQAFYVNKGGEYAGVGRPTADGFEWTPDNALAPTVARLVAIYDGKEPAVFVPVPVRAE
ncbi:MAG: DUF3450 family protein, partial [Planctomycetota bacterium]